MIRFYSSYVYEVYDFRSGTTEKILKHPKTEDFNKTIENYCGKLFKIIKIMLKYVVYKTCKFSMYTYVCQFCKYIYTVTIIFILIIINDKKYNYS